MKSLYFSGILSLTLCLGASMARAQYYQSSSGDFGPYFRIGVGPSFFQDGQLTQFGGPAANRVEFDTGLAADGAVGYAFNKFIAAEVEIGGVGAEINSVPGYFSDRSYLDNVSFMANVTLSCPIPRTILVPYIGVGGGGSIAIFDTEGFGNNSLAVFGSETDTVFAWQAFAGLRFQLNRSMLLGIGYKYFATEDTTFSYPPGFWGVGPNLPVTFDGAQTHSVLVSFQMKF